MGAVLGDGEIMQAQSLCSGGEEVALEGSVCGLKGFRVEAIGLSTLTLVNASFTSH